MAGQHIRKGIKNWSEEDRPREKLIQKGSNALTNSELLALLIGSGTRNRSAVQLARELLNNCGQDLNILARQNFKKIEAVKGIGRAKAITIVASMELARRRKPYNNNSQVIIKSSQDAYNYCQPLLADQLTEHFLVLLLRRNNTLIRSSLISNGGVSGTYVDPKVVFREAMENLASAMILIHNHPSGSLHPSKEDIRLTKKLLNAGGFLDIQILDHLIYTDSGYFSFADEGMM